MDNILTMRSGNRHTIGPNEQWVPKSQKEEGKQKGALGLGMGIHKRDGVYWFDNHKIKDLSCLLSPRRADCCTDSNDS